jgi:hypothetical protein
MLPDGTGEFLLFCATHRAQEGQRLASLRRLQSTNCPYNPLPLPRTSYT